MTAHGSPAESTPTRTIALINQKGGVGKTTTTVNLAAGLAELGEPVLVVDLDPQAHATLHLGLDPGAADGSIYDLLLEPETDPASLVREVAPNLSIIPSETDLAAAEHELTSLSDRQRRLARALAGIEDRYRYVLIDCPPSLGLLTINALAAAKEVIVPMQAHFLALHGVAKLLDTIRMMSGAVNPGLKVSGIVLCMHDANTTHTQDVVADLGAFFEQARTLDVPWRDARVFSPAIRRNIKLAECPSFGQTIFAYSPTAAGAADYRALARAVSGRPAEAVTVVARAVRPPAEAAG